MLIVRDGVCFANRSVRIEGQQKCMDDIPDISQINAIATIAYLWQGCLACGSDESWQECRLMRELPTILVATQHAPVAIVNSSEAMMMGHMTYGV